MKKKIALRCDMEGVSGVVSYQQVDPSGVDYDFGLKMFRSDLQACLEGLLAGGADEVLIYDEHFDGRNVDPSWLPEHVDVICGKPPYRADWAGGVDRSCIGMVMLGFHSKAGTTNALLNHTYEPDIANLELNGASVGEIGMEAAIAGDWDVPLLMITADSAGISEAGELISNVQGVSVKQSLGTFAARVEPLSVTAQRIRETACRVMQDPPTVKPFRMNGEVDLKIELREGPFLTSIRALYAGSMLDDHTVGLRGATATQVWSDYWQMKLQAQKHVKTSA